MWAPPAYVNAGSSGRCEVAYETPLTFLPRQMAQAHCPERSGEPFAWVPVFQSRSEASCLGEGTSQVKAQDELCTDGFAENAHACPPPGVPDAPSGLSETESSIRSSHLPPKCCYQTHTCNHTGWVPKGVLCFPGLAAKLGGKEQGKMMVGNNYRVLIYMSGTTPGSYWY